MGRSMELEINPDGAFLFLVILLVDRSDEYCERSHVHLSQAIDFFL